MYLFVPLRLQLTGLRMITLSSKCISTNIDYDYDAEREQTLAFDIIFCRVTLLCFSSMKMNNVSASERYMSIFHKHFSTFYKPFLQHLPNMSTLLFSIQHYYQRPFTIYMIARIFLIFFIKQKNVLFATCSECLMRLRR